MRIALVSDWLAVYGGAEHTIEEFRTLWPSAPLFTTVAKRGNLGPLDAADIRTTRLQRRYRILGHHQPLLAQMPRAVESIDLRGFDVILSSSHAVAKGIIPPGTSVHICYCHTPMRYAWEMEDQYLEDFRVPKTLQSYVRGALKKLRRWDLSTAKRVDQFIANSSETQERIRRIYARDSIVIHPPAADRFFQSPIQKPTSYKLQATSYLAVGRLVPYKRFDLLIELANKEHLPLIIAGHGQEEKRLKRMAGPTVTFAGFVSEDELPRLYATSKALLFPQYEDAGIVPLEAQASGTPVIAFGKGGARDTIVEGTTGLFFTEQTVDALKDAVTRFEKMQFDPAVIRKHAAQFSSERFRMRVKETVEETRSAIHR